MLFIPSVWFRNVCENIYSYICRKIKFSSFFFVPFCQMMRLVNYIKLRHSAPIKKQGADYGRHSNLTLCSHPPFILHLCLWPWFPFFFSYPQASVLSLSLSLSIYLISFLSLSLSPSLAALLYVKILRLSVSTLVSLSLYSLGLLHNHSSLLFCLSFSVSVRQSRQPAVGEQKQRAMCLSQTYSSALPLSHEWPRQWGFWRVKWIK